ncbi:MAG: hypothetical protein H6728_05690 [Myxococcales bacterium]|nr:hypothetical protein [Myxococcales bacterium]MCB9642549.1 hypothetical protein [Myxococcales bacterium]
MVAASGQRKKTSTSLWFGGRGFDLSFFHVPIWLCWLSLLLVPNSLLQAKMPIWGWVLIVLLIDVGHVWATIFRTYLDPEHRERNKDILFWIPVLCFAGAWSLAYLSDDLFWRVLAYIALYHFIKQQYGVTALYHGRLYGALFAGVGDEEREKRRRWLDRIKFWDKVCIYIATGFPVLYWHTHLPRKISWFSQGDFVSWLMWSQQIQVGLGQSVYDLLVYAFVTVWVASAMGWLWLHLRTAQLYGIDIPWGKIFWVCGTYLNWYIGIVHFDSPFAFALTNVIAHGIPYYGLVYLYTENAWRDPERIQRLAMQSWQPYLARRVFSVALFAVPVLFLSFWEEYLWDLLVHGREHMAFYGAFLRYPMAAVKDPYWRSFWIAMLSVPQATHYFLDGFLWKATPRNPSLKRYLGFG